MKKEQRLFFIILIVLQIVLVSASVTLKNENLERNYTGGGTIKGFLNITFSDENAHSVFSSNFNGTITLIDLLKANNFAENVDYTCTRKECEIDYVAGNVINNLNLNNHDNKLIGFKVTGNEIKITSLKLSLASDVGSSCERQIMIDVLDKNESFVQSMKGENEVCGDKYYGCFDEDAEKIIADIISSEYCEKINLPVAPAYMIGAKIENGSKYSKLTMRLYDSIWNNLGECELPRHTQEIQELSCRVNYSNIKKRDFFVCISSQEDDAEYKIETEESGDICGTDNSGSSFSLDYNIFAKAIKFSPIERIEINETSFGEQNDGNSLSDYADNYISEKYNRNCSQGCLIPFRIYGNSQTITINDATLKYTKGSSLTPYTSKEIYSIEKKDSKISSKKALNIDIGKAGFTIPILSTAKQLYLYLDGRSILPKPIAINVTPSFDFDIMPKIISIGMVTKFNAITSANITSSTWNFGDGITETSNSKSISHKYDTLPTGTNEYNLEVSLTRKDGVVAKKIFKIGIAPLSETANKLTNISDYKINIIMPKIGTYSPWIGELIKTSLNFDNMNSTVSNAKKSILNASTNEDYLAIINSILRLDIPYDITSKEKGTGISPLIGFEKIDTSAIEQISNRQISASERQQLKEAIIRWMTDNVEMVIEYEKISSISDSGEKILLTKFIINTNVKNGKNGYLIINYPLNSIRFNGNYSQSAAGSITYLPVTGQRTIEFAIIDNIEASDLGMHISPVMNEIYTQAELLERMFKWKGFIIWMIVLLVFAFATYIGLQEWYKRYYENFLFKNKDDFYNLINFIYNAKKAGMSDDELRKKLSENKWKGEQITYAIKKAEGKRTGMWEIPIFRYWEQLKIKAEIAKRTAQKATPSMPQQKQDMQSITGHNKI